MASNSIYQNGKNSQQSNGNGNSNNSSINNNANSVGNLHKSSSSHFNMKTGSNGGIGNTQTLPNGYRMHANKIPTKAEIDYHLENFIMSRKIALNGGNELRIDDKNISLHLNNPFVTAAYAQQIQAQKAFMQQQQQQHYPHNNFVINETISETTIPADQVRPKRPHSIAVSSPITLTSTTSLDNDLNLATTFSRRQKITTPNIISGGVINKMTTTAAGANAIAASPINFSQFNHLNGTSPNARGFSANKRNEFALYTPPSPVSNEVRNER